MDLELQEARQNFIQGMSRVSDFWGFPRAMGAIFGAVYLSPEPLSLDDIAEQVGISKGAASTNVRALERLGLVSKKLQLGDRKDYYEAEADFWQVVKGILREREKSEFDRALQTVDESLEMISRADLSAGDAELAHFYSQRMENMRQFFRTLDNVVATLLALDELRLRSLSKLLGKKNNNQAQ